MRDWTLPDPEAGGYGRGAVRVLELAFVRTRQVTQRVAQNREERASRAERRREARRRAKGERPAAPPAAAVEPDTTPSAPLAADELTSPVAGRLWDLIRRVQPPPEPAIPALPRSHPPPG